MELPRTPVEKRQVLGTGKGAGILPIAGKSVGMQPGTVAGTGTKAPSLTTVLAGEISAVYARRRVGIGAATGFASVQRSLAPVNLPTQRGRDLRARAGGRGTQ
jgi:hypothetical protein